MLKISSIYCLFSGLKCSQTNYLKLGTPNQLNYTTIKLWFQTPNQTASDARIDKTHPYTTNPIKTIGSRLEFNLAFYLYWVHTSKKNPPWRIGEKQR